MTVRWRTIGRVAAGLVILLTAVVAMRLGALERQGPAHTELSIGDGIPATLYVPFDDVDGGMPYQPPEGERPPVVVVAHGYSADQAIMSPIARSLAEAGYAALTFDFRGHGSNTNRFAGDLTEDLDAVVSWLQRSPHVDGNRIVVVGHSMGAGAVLDFATLDDRPVAVVPVSGGGQLHDDVVPEHVFLMVAAGDPGRIHDRQADLAADLADRDVNLVTSEISGTDHLTILYSNTAVRELVEFVDDVTGTERPGPTPGLDDDRLRVAALYLGLAIVMIGLIGVAAGRFSEPAGTDAKAGGLLLIAGSLALTSPVMAVGGVDVLPLGAGQTLIVQLLLAGVLLWGFRLLVARGMVPTSVGTWVGAKPWLAWRAAWAPGLAAALALFVLFLPLAGISHRMVPTPERLVYWVIVSAMALPFFAAFEALVRRGGTWSAIGWGALGRVILVLAIVIGLGAGVLPPVIGLVVPLLVVQFALLEVFAATCYAKGRNPSVIAVTESIFLAWIAVTFTPIG